MPSTQTPAQRVLPRALPPSSSYMWRRNVWRAMTPDQRSAMASAWFARVADAATNIARENRYTVRSTGPAMVTYTVAAPAASLPDALSPANLGDRAPAATAPARPSVRRPAARSARPGRTSGLYRSRSFAVVTDVRAATRDRDIPRVSYCRGAYSVGIRTARTVERMAAWSVPPVRSGRSRYALAA